MWRHREACIEARQSREECVAVGCTDQDLDHFAPGVKWFSLIRWEAAPTSHLFSFHSSPKLVAVL
jgi:hypothetical protein